MNNINFIVIIMNNLDYHQYYINQDKNKNHHLKVIKNH